MKSPTPSIFARRKPGPRPTCAGTGRYLWTRTTARGNTVVDHYGHCPDCTKAAAA